MCTPDCDFRDASFTKLGHHAQELAITQKHRQMLETIVSLLPAEKGSAHCSFLLKLLKAAIVLNVSSVSLRADLIRRIGLQLEEASVVDLLLPSANDLEWYDVDLVMRIMEHYLLQSQTPPLSPQVHKNLMLFRNN